MLRHALSVSWLAILPAVAGAAPKDMTVYGRAPVGAFGIDTLEHVEGAAKLGMTLVYSYSPDSARKQLDVDDPMGQAVAKHKMQVMYPYHVGKLDATTRNQMRFIMTRARSLQPDIGLIGIYQAFAYDESPQWKNMPTPEQVREDLLSFYDWGADGVMAFMYNPGEQTIVVLISLEDTAKGWWQRTVEIPPRVPMLLRVPMDEARLSIDPGHIQRWLLWEADPPAAVEFRLGTPTLAPAGKKRDFMDKGTKR